MKQRGFTLIEMMFTLIEMMIVVAIIGIIVAVILGPKNEKANSRAVQQQTDCRPQFSGSD